MAANALLYLRLSLIGIPGQLVVLAGTGYLRGLQDTAHAAAGGRGVRGRATWCSRWCSSTGWASGSGPRRCPRWLAQLGSAAVYVWWVRRAVRRHQVRLGPHGPTLRRLAVVGGDLFVRTVALRGALVVSTAVATRLGTVALAAHQIAFQIWNLLALALDAIAIAGQAMIGRFLGAQDVASARRAGRRMLEWGLAAGVVFGLVTMATRTVVPPIFTSDPAVVAVTSFVLVFVAAMQPVNGVVFVLDGLLIGAGDLRFLAVAMLVPSALFVAAGPRRAGRRPRHRLAVDGADRVHGGPHGGPGLALDHGGLGRHRRHPLTGPGGPGSA